MAGFAKIFSTILDSSIWEESAETRIVWITMLAMADAEGRVEASVGGLARRAMVPRKSCETAISVLLGPDPDSRDGTTGERIERVRGGWRILNHAHYRQLRTPGQVATAERVAKHRARKKQRETGVTVTDVTPGIESPASASASESSSLSEEQDLDTARKAFAFGLDAKRVAVLFGHQRKAARKGGAYALQMSQYDRATAVVEWSLMEGEGDPAKAEAAIERSLRAFFTLDDEFVRGAGYTFPHWASDPGRWEDLHAHSYERQDPAGMAREQKRREDEAKMRGEMRREHAKPPASVRDLLQGVVNRNGRVGGG